MRFESGYCLREYVLRPVITTPTGDCIATLSSTSYNTDALKHELSRMKRYGLIEGLLLDVSYCYATDQYNVRVA